MAQDVTVGKVDEILKEFVARATAAEKKAEERADQILKVAEEKASQIMEVAKEVLAKVATAQLGSDMGSGNVTEEAATGEAATTEEAAIAEEAAITEEAATTEEPATEEAATTEEPATGEAATTEEPATGEAATNEEPAITEESGSDDSTDEEQTGPSVGQHAGTVWRCDFCGRTETPQKRKGPNGPQTLCNACGVKPYYKHKKRPRSTVGNAEGTSSAPAKTRARMSSAERPPRAVTLAAHAEPASCSTDRANEIAQKASTRYMEFGKKRTFAKLDLTEKDVFTLVQMIVKYGGPNEVGKIKGAWKKIHGSIRTEEELIKATSATADIKSKFYEWMDWIGLKDKYP